MQLDWTTRGIDWDTATAENKLEFSTGGVLT
jgi:hypothetical protein